MGLSFASEAKGQRKSRHGWLRAYLVTCKRLYLSTDLSEETATLTTHTPLIAEFEGYYLPRGPIEVDCRKPRVLKPCGPKAHLIKGVSPNLRPLAIKVIFPTRLSGKMAI